MGDVERIRKEEIVIDNVLNFNRKKEIKYNLDGSVKKTHSNSVKGDPHEVYPLKTKEEIEKVKQYFRDKKENALFPEEKQIAGRNLMCFIVGINIGLRMSDILKLKWSDIFNKDGSFVEMIRMQEKKTKKYKNFFLNPSCQDAITDYINEFHPVVKPELFVFRSREGGAVEVRTVGEIIRKAGIACEIKLPLGSHTCRKTWSYAQIMAHQNDAYFMAHLMDLLNHSSISATLHYAGISDEQNKQYYNDVNL